MPTAAPTLRQLAEREERVFGPYPQPARYFAAASIDGARGRLSRAIERGDGPGLVVGAPGTGKSLLLQVLAAQYHARFDVVLLACARLCTRRALLQAVLFELGLAYRLRDEGELRLSLLDHLLSTQESPAGLLLLVDEAQTLPIALLDELRVLTNLVRGGVPRIRLVLAGSSTLEEAFASPELESFSQRLSARCYLAPFGRDETRQFIRAQLAAAGAAPEEVFAADAWDAVFEATDGVPRLVNQLCDRALCFAAEEDRAAIDRQTIQNAWSDLQQLPTPWETPPVQPAAEAASQVVEFGGLSDDFHREEDYLANDDAVTEPTEVDLDDCALDAVSYSDEPVEAEAVATVGVVNPFAEKFEEEEVVLDNFAAWDDMFGRDSPRVENRRDPGFASLVESAIALSPGYTPDNVPPIASLRGFAIDEVCEDNEDRSRIGLGGTAQPLVDAVGWPSLRLADVMDGAPTKPSELATSVVSDSDDFTMVHAADSAPAAGCPSVKSETAEAAILVVEDDAAPASLHSLARREDYRDLFSRLRGG